MSATKYTFRAVVEHPQLGTLNGCARIAAELFPRINNPSEDDSDAAKKKPAPETTITNFKAPTAVAYINSAGKIVLSRGAVKKIVASAGTDLALSHDGKKLLYVRSDSKSSPESTIVLYEFDTGRSRDLVHGTVRQSFWSLDDARIAYLTNQEQKWQVWTLQAAAPESPAPLYTNNINALHGWADTHILLGSDLQNAYWIADDGKPTQTVPLRDIYGPSFEVRDSDAIRVNPGNPDLLLVSANYAAGPLGAGSNANRPAGGIFLYELRTKRRVVLTPPEQSASDGEWSRDGVQIFYTVRFSSGTSSTYRVFWDGSAPKRYIAATDFVVGQ
jgi:Tol biopolymer transport system component